MRIRCFALRVAERLSNPGFQDLAGINPLVGVPGQPVGGAGSGRNRRGDAKPAAEYLEPVFEGVESRHLRGTDGGDHPDTTVRPARRGGGKTQDALDVRQTIEDEEAMALRQQPDDD